MHFILDGGAKLETTDYAAQHVTVSSTGASAADVRVGRSLIYRLSGLSRLNYYYDNPSLSVTQLELSGGSTVNGHPDASPSLTTSAVADTARMTSHFRFEAPVGYRKR